MQNRRVFVLTDSGVPESYARTIADQCPNATVYTIPQGEGSKCLKVYGQVLQAMLDFGMDRKDLLVAVGGGVVGDLGFFHRRQDRHRSGRDQEHRGGFLAAQGGFGGL